ncbi:MAG: (Fe-S)-binding protein [Thermoplasmatales archaeon]
MYLSSALLLFGIVISAGLFFWSVFKLLWYMIKIPGKLEAGRVRPKILLRIWLGIRNILLQGKLFKDISGGIMHALMFWGFLAFASYSIDFFATGIDPSFHFFFSGILEDIIFFTVDIFALVVAADVVYAVIRRWVLKIKRYRGYSGFEAAFILFLVEALMISYLFLSALRIEGYTHGLPGAIMENLPPSVTPVSLALSKLIPHISRSLAVNIYWSLYTFHAIIFLTFLAYIPMSKHLHLLAAPFNVLLTEDKPRGMLPQIDFEKETRFGATDLRDFTWKDYLDFYSCTECGRCTAACPANLTGKTLSPRDVIWDLRKALLNQGEEFRRTGNGEALQPVIGSTIREEDLWSCTTCSACVEECPVMINHVDKIVDMRRSLVLNKGSAPKGILDVYGNLEAYGSPWTNDPSTRAAWAGGLEVVDLSKTPDAKFEYLFWVGCSGSYDPRNQNISRSLVKILKEAGISFAILGSEERCTGDPARRSGNEYLAQTLTSQNVETFKKFGVKKVITICPHCFNTFKNDYSPYYKMEVIHHTEFIENLIREGKIKLEKKDLGRVTYHDSCYLARYNSVTDAPRFVIKNISDDFVEMEMNGKKGLCCGAGGARMWMEENVGTKISHMRIDQASKVNAKTVVTACPYCMSMLDDARKVTNREDMNVLDLAEVVASSIDSSEPRGNP